MRAASVTVKAPRSTFSSSRRERYIPALSVKTVSTFRSRVMEKLGLATNSDLTYYALKNGLIQ